MIASTPTIRVTLSAGKFNDSRRAWRIVVGPCCSFVASLGE